MTKKSPFTGPAKLGELSVEYERFFEVALDMMCISSYDGHFKKVNPAFEQVLGFSADELCSKSYLDFIHPDDIDRTIKEVEAQLKSKQMVFNFENRYRCKDGGYKWLSWKSAPVGEFMYAVARDITESKQAHEDLKLAKASLEVANRELESFSYSVAHDLRAPARTVLSFGAIVLEESDAVLNATSKEYLGRIINAGRKMGLLVDGLLSLARLAKQDLTKQPINLSALVRDVADDLIAAHPGRNVDFEIAQNVHVEGDPTLLKMVVTNLFSNAWKYSSKIERPVRIEFGVTQRDGERAFFVRDNGAGFDMNFSGKLFGIFQRLHNDREFEGTGVGLATVQRVIQRHGGKVWANGVVNEGATFYFTL